MFAFARAVLIPTPVWYPAAIAAALFFSCGLGVAQEGDGLVHRIARDGVLGTSSELVVEAASDGDVDRIENAVFAEVARLDAILSTWDDGSELAKLIQSGSGQVSADLQAVFALADKWRTETAGAYEPGVAKLSRLWGDASKSGSAPDGGALQEIVAGFVESAWQQNGSKITLRAPISLDALAKGFVVDRAFAAGVKAAGENAKVLSFQIGGDLRIGDATRTIGIVDPQHPTSNATPLHVLQLTGRAVASSGGYERGIKIGGKMRSHILDPRTGQPCDDVLGASVVASDVATADVLATVMCVLGPKHGLELLRKVDGAEAVIVTADGKSHASAGWQGLCAAEHLALAAKHWPKGFQLDVHFEIKAPANAQSGRRRGGWKRPYVAVWVEDLTGTPAKTLCLWLGKRKWLRDLRRWSRQYRDLDHVLDARSQATRRAGSYKVTWDGTDDDGNLLAPGRYTVYVEVVREHGSYQLIRRDVVLGSDALRVDLGGNKEVETASLRFGRPSAGSR